MSLLGKDQETVMEALKTLAENGERLKATETELEEVKKEVEDLKDENKQNQKKIKDLLDDLQYERNENEDLEIDLKKTEKQVDILKHGIRNKDSIIDGLDKILKEKENEMNKLGETKAIEEKKGTIQNNVIKELKDKLNEKEEIISDGEREKEELDNLLKEIKQLEGANKEKERMLDNIVIENEKLKVTLEKLESTKENLSLGDELNLHVSKTFICEECGKSFDMRSEMNLHIENVHEKVNDKKLWTAKLTEMEIKICGQKVEISSGIFRLKEKELNLNKICRCRGFCRINHQKHSWSKSRSTNLFGKMLNLNANQVTKCQGAVQKSYTCDSCEENFVKMIELRKHKKTTHKSSPAITA